MRLSVLDHSPVDYGCTATDALWASTRLAQTAESAQYERYWVAEHHQSDVQASSNPELLMMHIAAHTQTIRVGSGGIMLPHYSAYKVAESVRVLAALYPARVDLGVGRAPGADQRVSQALNDEKGRTLPFSTKLRDLKGYLINDGANQSSGVSAIRALPQISILPEFHVLGASGSTAELAASEGLGFTFAHFINPHHQQGIKATAHYRAHFKPSKLHTKPSVIVAIFVVVAQTNDEAQTLAISFDEWLLRAESLQPSKTLMPPHSIDLAGYTPAELERIATNRARVVIGDASSAMQQLRQIAAQYQTDQMMIIPMIPGEKNRQRAIELLGATKNTTHHNTF